MLQKTDNKLTGNERLSNSTHSFGFYFNSPILFVLSFVLCLFLSFSFASADPVPYPDENISSLDDFYSSYFPSGYDSFFNSYKSQFEYYQCLRYYNSSTLKNCYIINFLPCEYASTNIYSSSSQIKTPLASFRYTKDAIISIDSNSNNNALNKTFVSFCYCEASSANRMQITSFVPSQFASSGSGYISVNGNYTYIGGNYNDGVNFSYNQFYGYISNCYSYYTLSNNKFVLSEPNTIIYSDDDRLKLYTTQSASQGSLLHVDLSEFYQYNNGVSSNYSFSDVVLTLDCDGTENTFTLSPFGLGYEFLDSSTASSRVYGYVVPYSFFSVSSYQNCSVVKVDFTRTISSSGGSGSEAFYISCQYRLKTTNINGNAQDFASVTLAPVPSVTVAPDQSTVQDWSDNTSYKSPAFGHNGSYVLLNSLPIFPDWVDKYTLDCTRVNKTVDGITLNLWIDLDNPYVSVNTALVDIPVTAFFTPESYLKDNVLTDFYDVVVFKVWSDTGKTSVDGYLYFYTEKYDLKYQNNLVVQELSLEYDSLNLLSSGFSLIRTGLDNIDNNTAAYFTDSLFNDTIVISWLQTLNNTNAFGFVDVVNAIEDIPQYDDSSVVSGIASVVSAIEGIDSPDLSDLESKLDTLINFFVADGSTENASSRTYRNWLRGVDDNTSRTVTYYADNVFSIVHDVFDLFDADGSVYYPPDSEDVVSTDYLNFVKLFIEKMNSSTVTNTGYNKYLRGFFQGGFDPHLIDGGL